MEGEGRRVLTVQKIRELSPGWMVKDAWESADLPSCVITGANGVLIPMVTQTEKQKRRANRQAGRKAYSTKKHHQKHKRQGADQAYKEFKLVAFYDL